MKKKTILLIALVIMVTARRFGASVRLRGKRSA